MENQVEEIKQKLDIVTVISHSVPIQKRGRHYTACCPFHQEKSPSFIVSQDLQIFKCFGCGKSGDVFTFIQEYDRVDFREALEILAKEAGVTLIKSDNSTREESHQKRLVSLNNEIAKFYNYILLSHPIGQAALDYVLNRGITKETINKFMIGFAPPNSQLIVNFLLKKNYTGAELVATGTFAENKYGPAGFYDRFQDRLIFPLADYRDRILGFSGRILPGVKNPNSAKYINSPETEIYHKSHMLFGLNITKDSIRRNNSVIVTEGEFDMISPYQIGIDNIVALKGTAFTLDQLQLLRRYTDTLILGLDSDFAGNNAALKSIELADSLEFDIQVLLLGDKYKDPDEAVKGDPEFFKSQLQKTVPVWDFIIQSTVKSHSSDTVKGKKEILSIVIPFLLKINNSVIKADYFKKLANEIGSDLDAVYDEARKHSFPTSIKSERFKEPQAVIDAQVSNTRLEKLEELLITLILGSRQPSLLAQRLEKYLSQIKTPRFQVIVQSLISASSFDPQIFQSNLAAEIRPLFQSLFLAATQAEMGSEDRLKEIKTVVNQISLINIEEKINQNSLKIAQLEAQDQDTSKLDEETSQLITQKNQLRSKKV